MQGCPTNTQSILGNGQRLPPNGQGVAASEHRSLTRAQGRPSCCEGCSRNLGGTPTRSHSSPRSSWSIRRKLRRHRSPWVGRPYVHVGGLSERRRKLSEPVGQPTTQGERPSSRAGMPSVLGLQLSELAELPCVFVSTLAVFGGRPSAWRRTLYPFRRMPYSFVGASWSAPTAAPRDRSDALEEAWAAVPEEGDALREPRDSLLEPRDTLGIRGDAVRRQGRDSRRVTRSSRSSCRGGSVSEAATRTRGAALTTQGDASQAARDALDGIRDAQRKEDDARGEAPKPVPTSSSGSPVRRADTTARDVRRGIRRSVTRVGAHWCTSQVEGAPMLCAAVPSLPCPFR